MKKIIVLIILNGLFYQNYAQTGDAITNRLTKDLEEIYSQGPIVGFSVAIVNQEGILFNKGLDMLIRTKIRSTQKIPFRI